MELTHTRILVDNYKECFLFYRDVLGLEVTWGDEHSNYADFKFNNNAAIGLFDRKEMVETIGGTYSADSKKDDRIALIFKVKSVGDTYQALKNKITFITEPTERRDWGLKTAHFRDPAGSLIEIYENIGHH